MKITQREYIAGKRTAIATIIGASVIYGCATNKWGMPIIAGLVLGSVVVGLIFAVFYDMAGEE